MEPYDVFLLVLGVAVLGSVVLPRVLHRPRVSLPTLQLAAGVVLYWALPALPAPDPFREGAVTERLSELVVIVSLTGAGLKIDRRWGWRSWQPTWRLLALAMPLTIGATALLGAGVLGLVPATALLLGAVIAPTDPVLASDVQVGRPNAEGDEGDVQVALTAEAGLNDALAFPFVHAAIAMAAGGSWLLGWAADDVVLKITVGLVVGWLAGKALGRFAFRDDARSLAQTRDGIAAVGATLVVYGLAELAHGYGFLAVFVAAVVLRDHEREHEYHAVLHEAAETVERLGSALLLLLVGGAITEGGLAGVGWREVAVALAIVVVVRPVLAWLCLVRTELSRGQRLVTAVFGIRGMGSIYYLAYAGNHADLPGLRTVWAVVLITVVLSVVGHGATASRAVRRAEEDRQQADG